MVPCDICGINHASTNCPPSQQTVWPPHLPAKQSMRSPDVEIIERLMRIEGKLDRLLSREE